MSALHLEENERQQQTQAEGRIRELAAMLNQAHDAIIIIDTQETITFWNRGAEGLFGWTSAEAFGRKTSEVFPPESNEKIRIAGRETDEMGAWRGELELRNKRGQAIVVDCRRTLIRDEAGRPKAQLCINTDITEKKRLSEQLQRAQRTENIGMLAAGIAHDLNNILAPMLLVAPMLREKMTDPEDRKMLTMLEKSAERGAGLVRQILSFVLGSTGEPRLMQVRHIVKEIGSVIGETFPKNIRFEDQTRGDLWPIRANPTQLQQVLLNLSVNARDAMPNGGTLRISAEQCSFDEKSALAIEGCSPGHYVMIAVEDTGTGIAPEQMTRIWEPFFTTKSAGKGTGLGLSTVRGIMDNYRGFVTVNSKLGHGTCFRLYFPAAPKAVEDRASDPPTPRRRGNGELVLIVDDEKHVRDLAAVILSRSGYRVLTAADGVEAAALFAQRSREISLVVSDTHMPSLDGPSLARTLKRIDSSVGILAISGLSENESGAKGLFGGLAADFLRKPFKPDALVSKVYDLIQAQGDAAPAK